MKIHEIQENLRNTIKGKEVYLAREIENRQSEDAHVRMVAYTVSKMLEHNIDELKLILADVDKAVKQYNELGWTLNPERMGQ